MAFGSSIWGKSSHYIALTLLPMSNRNTIDGALGRGDGLGENATICPLYIEHMYHENGNIELFYLVFYLVLLTLKLGLETLIFAPVVQRSFWPHGKPFSD